jgi:hypothetical protein
VYLGSIWYFETGLEYFIFLVAQIMKIDKKNNFNLTNPVSIVSLRQTFKNYVNHICRLVSKSNLARISDISGLTSYPPPGGDTVSGGNFLTFPSLYNGSPFLPHSQQFPELSNLFGKRADSARKKY